MRQVQLNKLYLWVSDREKVISMHPVDGYTELEFPDRALMNELLMRMIEEYYKIQ